MRQGDDSSLEHHHVLKAMQSSYFDSMSILNQISSPECDLESLNCSTFFLLFWMFQSRQMSRINGIDFGVYLPALFTGAATMQSRKIKLIKNNVNFSIVVPSSIFLCVPKKETNGKKPFINLTRNHRI